MIRSEEDLSKGVKYEAEQLARGKRIEQGRTECLRRKKIHEVFNKKLQ